MRLRLPQRAYPSFPRTSTQSVADLLFSDWEVPPPPGSSFIFEAHPNRPQHLKIQSIPPPASRSAIPPLHIRRALVVSSITKRNLPVLLDKIHCGALDFLSSVEHLSAASRLRALVDVDATWKWLPGSPLPQPVARAIATHRARRALHVSWTKKDDSDLRLRLYPITSPIVERRWVFGTNRVVVQFFDISEAIRARAKLDADPTLHVRYFPDWCELGPSQRALVRAVQYGAADRQLPARKPKEKGGGVDSPSSPKSDNVVAPARRGVRRRSKNEIKRRKERYMGILMKKAELRRKRKEEAGDQAAQETTPVPAPRKKRKARSTKLQKADAEEAGDQAAQEETPTRRRRRKARSARLKKAEKTAAAVGQEAKPKAENAEGASVPPRRKRRRARSRKPKKAEKAAAAVATPSPSTVTATGAEGG
ncbi:hypothetical protein DFH09DRAFT_1180863 [Mycena vulgaris]|nr:hypothetical protein DFH09DRAFT_1180863 [Mycena vulgaris]